MKRIAALSLVAALAATGVAADDKKTEPTVSTQAGGLTLAGMGGMVPVMTIVAVSTLAAAQGASNSTTGTN